jgi:hypothetical protein
MAGIEIGAMSKQCLDRRIADMDTLKQELSTWPTKRNDEGAHIN